VRETLVEDEILDVQIDTLSPEEFLREVCRKIGRPPHPIRSPHDSDDVAETEADDGLADREPAEDWPQAPDESGAGRPVPEPPKSDSS
jgi:hypothetical protein